MYVRGKYGKSLKLEQLRKDCIGGPGSMDLMNMNSGNNNNNSCKIERESESTQQNTRPSSREETPQPPVFNPFTTNFYPDFGASFPIPVSMIHLLPQSEKNREHYGQQPQAEEECKNQNVKKEVEEDMQQDMFRTPALSRDDRRELVQQNGQD